MTHIAAKAGSRATDRALREWVKRGCAIGFLLMAAGSQAARADEAGVSFWVPGLFGSLAAVQQVPGASFAGIYYHTSVSAGADVAFARQVSAGNLNAHPNADADLGFAIPQYVFATPVLGGQAGVSLLVPFGNERASVDTTLNGSLGLGGPSFTTAPGRTDDVTGPGDFIPLASLRWNSGVHNWMTYITGDIPIGDYDPTRLANIGLGHGVIDFGGGYTYFNPQTGHEFIDVRGDRPRKSPGLTE